MRRIRAIFALAAIILCLAANALAQTAPAADAGATANGVIGEVVAIDRASKQMFVKTDSGVVVIVTLADGTTYKRVPPGQTTLASATDITLAEVGAGDRVFARGKPSDDRKIVTARMVIVMTKGDIAQKQNTEREEWKRRGVVGVVTAINADTKEITLQARGPQGAQPVVIKTAASTKFRHYVPDSVKFGDATPSTLADVKTGDQLRAKGERSADGASFTPEEVVTGTFRTTIGTITAINAEKNELTVAQTQGGVPLTIVVSKDSLLKRVPEGAAGMMGGGAGGPGAGGMGGGNGGFRGPASKGQLVEMLKSNRLEPDRMTQMIARRGVDFQLKPDEEKELRAAGAGDELIAAVRANYRKPGEESAAAARPQGSGGGVPGGGAGTGGTARVGGGFDVQQMLEMLPAATLSDLKPGSMVVVSSTVGADPSRVTAIQLVSGIEPLVAMMTRRLGGGPGAGSGGAGAGAGGGIGFGFGIGQP